MPGPRRSPARGSTNPSPLPPGASAGPTGPGPSWSCPCPPYACPVHAAVSRLVARRGPSIVARLSRAYPRMCRGRLEDALQAALVDVLAAPERYRDLSAAELERRVRTVAWRQARGQWRKRAYQCEASMPAHDVFAAAHGPYEDALAAELIERLPCLIGRAAVAYGGRQPERFAEALRTRLLSGEPDTAIAQAHGVPRASLWPGAKLGETPAGRLRAVWSPHAPRSARRSRRLPAAPRRARAPGPRGRRRPARRPARPGGAPPARGRSPLRGRRP